MTAEWVNALGSLDIRIDQRGELTVVLIDDYLQLGLQDYNEQVHKSGVLWMLIKPVGSVL